MFKLHEIREMIKLVDQSSIQEFEVEGEEAKISIKKGGSAVAAAQPVQVTAEPQPEPQPAAPVAKAPEVEAPKAPAPQAEEPATPAKELDENLHKITSPMVGTFYKAPEPGADAYVKPGAKVEESSIVCIVEAMKLFNEIEAEVRGEIVEVLVEDGQLVEYGQPLFLVKPE